VLDRSTGALTEFYEAGPAVDTVDWRRFIGSAVEAIGLLPPGSVVALSGSVPPDADPADVAAESNRDLVGSGDAAADAAAAGGDVDMDMATAPRDKDTDVVGAEDAEMDAKKAGADQDEAGGSDAGWVGRYPTEPGP
jgi:hypothetical protein